MRVTAGSATLALAVGSIVGGSLAAQPVDGTRDQLPTLREATFSSPTEQFFTGTATRATYFGCAYGNPFSTAGTALCATAVYEIGVERATGLGAARSLLTRVTGRVWEDRYAFGSSDGVIARAVDLSIAPGGPASPGVGQLGIGGLTTPGGELVRRSIVGAGIQWETWDLAGNAAAAAGSFDAFLTYVEEASNPGECGGRHCSALWSLTPRRVAIESVPTVTPEPSTWALLGTGLLSLGTLAARRRKRAGAWSARQGRCPADRTPAIPNQQ